MNPHYTLTLFSIICIQLSFALITRIPRYDTACPADLCKHGGIIADDCTSCSGCLGAWTGRFCDVYASDIPIDIQVQDMMSIAQNSAHQQQVIHSHFRILANQIGMGVDITTGQLRMPVVHLTYGDSQYTDIKGKDCCTRDREHVGTTWTLPDEAEFTVLTDCMRLM